MHYSNLGYTKVYYSTLQYATVPYSTLQYPTVHYTTLQYPTVHYITLPYPTVHYSILQYTKEPYSTLQYTTEHYTTLHYTTLRYMMVLRFYQLFRGILQSLKANSWTESKIRLRPYSSTSTLSFHQSKVRTMTYSVVKKVLAKINTFEHIHFLFRKRTNDSLSANTVLNFHENSWWQSLLLPRTKCLFSSRHEISSRGGHTLKRCHIQEHLALKTQCSMGPESKQTPQPPHTSLLCLNTC